MKKYLGALLAGAALMMGSPVAADTITIDFETYPTGPIANGYDGWKITNPAWDQ